MVRNPMQDIVPKGKSIRNIEPKTKNIESKTGRIDHTTMEEETVRVTRGTPITRNPRIIRKVKDERPAEVIIDREESETVIEVSQEEIERKESLRQAREEFEQRRTKKSRKSSRSSGMGLGFISDFWNNNRRTVLAIGAVAVVVLLSVGLTSFFKSALITVTPRTLALTANADFTAQKDSTAAGELPFSTISIKASGNQIVKAAGQKQVSTRASGTIVVYNNYSAAPQRLIKNTRFATPEGLIFRISDSVTVPGKKGATPGSVEAIVIADEAGTNYNVGLKDFTIPGFKGDPRYGAFYARSKTALAGGFVGVQKIVADADRAKAKSEIEAKLKDELLKQVALKRTATQIFYNTAYTIDYVSLPDEVASASEANIKEEATINAVVFDQGQLASALARTYIKDYKGDALMMPLASNLTFTPKDFKPATASAITFHLTGNATFEWAYDEAALKLALKGQTRTSTPVILRKFPMIEKADISLRPFWTSSFPGSVDKITIKKAI